MQARLKRKISLKRKPWVGISALMIAFVLGVLCPYTCYVDACFVSSVEECTPAVMHDVDHGESHDHDDCEEPLAHDHDLLYSCPALTKRVVADENVLSTVPLTYAAFRPFRRTSTVTRPGVPPVRDFPMETIRLLI